MMSQFDAVLTAASQLPLDDRLRLIDALAATVPDDRPPSLSAEWLAEIERRSSEIDAGSATTVPWEIVKEALAAKIEIQRED